MTTLQKFLRMYVTEPFTPGSVVPTNIFDEFAEVGLVTIKRSTYQPPDCQDSTSVFLDVAASDGGRAIINIHQWRLSLKPCDIDLVACLKHFHDVALKLSRSEPVLHLNGLDHPFSFYLEWLVDQKLLRYTEETKNNRCRAVELTRAGYLVLFYLTEQPLP